MTKKLAGVSIGVMGAAVCHLAFASPIQAEGGVYVAGTEPHKRPQSAPVIDKVVKEPGWKQSALKGVSKPYPDSLKFLSDQGNWFNPFLHPGMTGRYDIRGWHTGRGQTVEEGGSSEDAN